MFYTDAVKIINYTNILSKTQLELSFWKDNFFYILVSFVVLFFLEEMKQEHKRAAMLLTSVCFGMEFCLCRHMFILLSVFGGFVMI